MNTKSVVALAAAILVVIAAVVYLGFKQRPGSHAIIEFGYPVIPSLDFNRIMVSMQGSLDLTWDDNNNDDTFILTDGSIDGSEFSGKGVNKFITKKDNKFYFNQSFEPIYLLMTETFRTEKVGAELALTTVEPEITDVIARLKGFPDVTDTEIAYYRDGVKKLMEAAPLLKLLYQKQIGTDADIRIKAKTDADRELIDRYGHPWCLSDASPFCAAIPSLPRRTSGTIPEGIGCEQANSVSSPFESVSYDPTQRLVAVPYSQTWPAEHVKLSTIMKEAAGIFEKIPRESKFTTYLMDLIETFVSKDPYPHARADVSWADFLSSDSLLYARIGADEVGGDGVGDDCETKARYHFNIGIRSAGAHDIIERIRPVVSKFENKFAEIIADPQNYVARDVQVHLPVFIDVIYANGDDVGGPNGTPIGQTLPNWCGADGKGECAHATMIYVNKTTKAYNEKIMKEYIVTPLFSPEIAQSFSTGPGLDSVVYHEMFHNMGPTGSTKKPNSEDTYGKLLVASGGESWKLPTEELKAQTGSLFMANEFYKEVVAKHAAGEMDDASFTEETKRYRQHIAYDFAWSIRMILRASRSGPEFSSKSPYSRLSTIQIGFLTEQGALNFNNETGQWSIDFDKMPAAIDALIQKVGKLYATTNADEVEKTFLYYMKGDGEKLLHRDRIVEAAAKMPSVLFDYQVKGLE